MRPPGAAPRRALALLLALVGPVPAAAQLTVAIDPPAPRPGDVVVVRVREAPADLGGTWGERPLRWFPAPEGRVALVGVDLEASPGPLPWRLTRPMANGGALVVGAGLVTVRSRNFPTQRLTLPPAQVDLDAAALARVETERAQLAGALGASLTERLWRDPFRPPLAAGRLTGGFGLRRIVNGQPRAPHAGVDWAAPQGTPVLAANTGRVALVAEHFFPGRLVVLDHGLGLFTLYFHLDGAAVAPGEVVRGGQPIGAVGATGRTTGPHLHFAVVLDGARVDPLALLGRSLPGGALYGPAPGTGTP